MSSNTAETKIGAYLLERLVQLGTRSVQGVPVTLTWAFSTSSRPLRLNLGGQLERAQRRLCADGYARIKGTIAAVVTTFGVGELSALTVSPAAFRSDFL